MLRSGGNGSKTAGMLLERYIPEGPGKEAGADAWGIWIKTNEPYLFFSESGGVRWYLDPLAQKRHIPTAKLRDRARADIAGKPR